MTPGRTLATRGLGAFACEHWVGPWDMRHRTTGGAAVPCRWELGCRTTSSEERF